MVSAKSQISDVARAPSARADLLREMRRSVELALLIAAICATLFLVRGDWRGGGVSVHPFWLPVLLFATRYGLVWGVGAAAVCSAIVLASQASAGAALFAVLAHAGMLPLAWGGAAVLVGGARDMLARQLAARDKALAQAQADLGQVEHWAEDIRQQNAALRDRLSGFG